MHKSLFDHKQDTHERTFEWNRVDWINSFCVRPHKAIQRAVNAGDKWVD